MIDKKNTNGYVGTINEQTNNTNIYAICLQKDLGEMECLVRIGRKINWSRNERWCNIGDRQYNVSKVVWERFWYSKRKEV